MESASLHDALEAGAVIAGCRDDLCQLQRGLDAKDEGDVLLLRLKRRLEVFAELRSSQTTRHIEALAEVQEQTGSVALHAIILINHAGQQTRSREAGSSSGVPVPIYGSRDLKTLSTLLSIVTNWKLAVEIKGYDAAARRVFSKSSRPKLEEIKDAGEDAGNISALAFGQARQRLHSTLCDLDVLLSDSSTVREQLLDACSLYIVAIGIRLGWGPRAPGGRSDADNINQHATTFVKRLLRAVSTGTCLKLLSNAAAISGAKPTPRYLKSTTEMLFAAQLLRPDGVLALLRNSFDAGDDNERGLMKKLVSIGQLLSTPPSRMPIGEFATALTPRLLEVIAQLPTHAGGSIPSQYSSPSQKNAAAFALARLNEVAHDSVGKALDQHLFSFLDPTPGQGKEGEGDMVTTHEQLALSLELLAEVVNQSEPSSNLLQDLLRPHLVALFVISDPDSSAQPAKIQTMASKKKAESNARLSEVASDLLRVYLRLVEPEETSDLLSPASRTGIFRLSDLPVGSLSVKMHDGSRLVSILSNSEDGICVRWSARTFASNSSMPQLEADSFDVRFDREDLKLPTGWLSSLRQRPSPSHLTTVLKKAERKDIASALLVDLLDVYTQVRKTKPILAPESGSSSILQGVLYIQHIVQLIEAFGSDCLHGDKVKILRFIVFALGAPTGGGQPSSGTIAEEENAGQHIDVPLVRPTNGEGNLPSLFDVSAGKKKNDSAPLERGGVTSMTEDDDDQEEELVETALSLLLSLLESDADLTTENLSLLRVIADRVGQLTNSDNPNIRPLAKEGSLVLKARQSSKLGRTEKEAMKSTSTPKQQALERGREMYQEALKLLQDPILPVRAHGLVILKDLVSFGSSFHPQAQVIMDPALTVAVLDIFLQAICDDESFLYLNAVKGLSEMGNTGGRTMIKQTMAIYLATGTQTKVTQAEADKRLRVGEALLQVIQKLDQALAAYVDDIVAPLLAAIRSVTTPTTLRSSMLSILGTCIEACPKAMAAKGHAAAICDAMLDLLSVETQSRGTTDQNQMDSAVEISAKVPHLRRAALLLLSLLLRGSSMQLQEASDEMQNDGWKDENRQLSALRMPGGGTLRASPSEEGARTEADVAPLLFPLHRMKRTRTVVAYVAQTDSDELSRHQAGEVLQDAETLELYALQHGQLTL